jgi:SWI/SNF-related matrix-associated actin-dependent regulator of chromatin subfamily A member 5
MLDIMEDFMHLRGIPYARLDGSTSRPRRSLDIKLVSEQTFLWTRNLNAFPVVPE